MHVLQCMAPPCTPISKFLHACSTSADGSEQPLLPPWYRTMQREASMRYTFVDSHRIAHPIRAICPMILALLLLVISAGAHAASIYRCVDAQGHLGFQDTRCAAHARQSKIDLHPLPTIGDAAEVTASRARLQAMRKRRTTRHTRHPHTVRRRIRAKTRMSWECRAADGEVFYRHAHCPSSIPGDGVVRTRPVENMSSTRTRERHNAWSRVRVHGVRISRTEACRRIHSAGAAVRDGHQRDATVSTYDHLMGRDPCGS
jgi:Domain of unknown function (DUF4124)